MARDLIDTAESHRHHEPYLRTLGPVGQCDLVVDGRCEPLVTPLRRGADEFGEAAHAFGQGQAGGPEPGGEWEALSVGPCGSMSLPVW
ncbi:hypothetical protein ADL02_13435 [Streptomyces sp. NRRL WC-3723]|nr:hypothetical protein ADL02_13435 [Streptomyces sp. NRRL WC-3723]